MQPCGAGGITSVFQHGATTHLSLRHPYAKTKQIQQMDGGIDGRHIHRARQTTEKQHHFTAHLTD